MNPEVKATGGTEGGTPATGRIVLGTSCTIHEARSLREQMLAQAGLPGPYEIDGSAVQQVDTAGVQLVVAFALDCLERSASYSWKGRSPALEDAIRVLGVAALLESPG
jgi:anti-anti-sigma regulatory factor